MLLILLAGLVAVAARITSRRTAFRWLTDDLRHAAAVIHASVASLYTAPLDGASGGGLYR